MAKQNNKLQVNSFGNVTIEELTDEMIFIKDQIEELLLKHGFKLVDVNSKYQRNGSGFYKFQNLYCTISFMRNLANNDEVKNWVFIEYANSLTDAENGAFEDGDIVPMDIPLVEVITETENLLLNELEKIVLDDYQV